MSVVKPPSEWTVLGMLEWATSFFIEKHVPNPRLSIEWLLAHSLGIKRLDLYLQFDRPLKVNELDALRPLVQRRAKHEPLQYIVGETDFYSVTLAVNKHVLIPRPETEELVEWILQEHPENEPKSVLDIGTGSGCIAISLKKERPNWDITGIDISPNALEVAEANANKNNTLVHFELGNLFAERVCNGKKFDIIVSNPPYIAPKEAMEMQRQVTAFEPHLALFTERPERVYEAIQYMALRQLKPDPNAALYVEINESLAESILKVYSPNTWTTQLKTDSFGKNRMIKSYLRNN
jgi:release factor glutamine methyltransferase